MSQTEVRAANWMKRYLRYTDYIGVAQLYLKSNFLLKERLKIEDIKPRILGHWGTVPGLNLIYAGLNYIVNQTNAELLLITGPGHGAPSTLANLFAEGTMAVFYPEYSLNEAGMGKLIKDFSWPHSRFPSHVTPSVPGSILEGGELGYSLSTAFGAVFDNPNLIAAAIVGDGEAETGALAAAWHSNKFLNPKTSGAVLPIVHVNGYKISNPTIYGTMSDQELFSLFCGYGYLPLIVKGPNLEIKYLRALVKAYRTIRAIQKKARSSLKPILKPNWPVIILRSPKGWKGVPDYHGKIIEGSFHSHGIPVGHPNEDPDCLKVISDWLQSYKIQELVDEKGRPRKEVLAFVPAGSKRLGMCKHAYGGKIYRKLKLPKLANYEVKIQKPGALAASSMGVGAKFLRDLIKSNQQIFRLFCPDEIESNKLSEIFKSTSRAYQWPINEKIDEFISPDGRAMEMLSEHTLQGWMQGYLLTGRHGLFVSYEAFATIITSMVDQYAKFLKQSFKLDWRQPVASANYLLSSVGWRQDHNGYSHQNPSFVSNVLAKHGEFCQIYYPADANSLLAAYEEVFQKQDSICVIVAGKRDLPQWLTLDQAREQAKTGIAIWDWVGGREASKNPDVVLTSAGDYITQEAIFGAKLARKLVPEIKIRYVNVSEITSICLGDYCSHPNVCFTEAGVNHYFTKDKPVVFNYHGYVGDIEQILWPYTTSSRFEIHGYSEKGSTTTPFDIKIANKVSSYHIAIDLICQAAKSNPAVANKQKEACLNLQNMIEEHQRYIEEYGDDPAEVKNMKY